VFVKLVNSILFACSPYNTKSLVLVYAALHTWSETNDYNCHTRLCWNGM